MWRIATILAAAAVFAPGALAGDDDVSVTRTLDSREIPCGEVDVRGVTVSGGCEIDAVEAPVTLTALTVLGDELLGVCPLKLSLYIGDDGEVGVDDIYLRDEAGPQSRGCGDILACRRDIDRGGTSNPHLPWKGRVIGDGGSYRIELDACFDTCLGRFEGPLELRFRETANNRWRMSAAHAGVGTSGLEASGAWKLEQWFEGNLRIAGD